MRKEIFIGTSIKARGMQGLVQFGSAVEIGVEAEAGISFLVN
jgi:hypothetical protein